MKTLFKNSRLQHLIKHRNAFLGFSVMSMSLNVMLSIGLILSMGHERIVLLPPTLHQSFWVGHNDVSPQYLVEMSDFFVSMRFNVSPNSIHSQQQTLLHYIDPSAYEAMKIKMLDEAEHITKEHVTTAFYPMDIKVNAKALQAYVIGDLMTTVGNTVLPIQRVKYRMSYQYNNGRLWVKSFEEVKDHV